jgi:cytochrome b6-f complex iron-sulfur subunit
VDWTRRDALDAAWGGLVLAGIRSLSCSSDAGPGSDLDAPPSPLTLPVSGVPEGARVTVFVAGNPVELVRTGASVTARSLRCTHQGCVVRWKEEAGAYVCPCHEGRYDRDGAVLAGPPPAPLRRVHAVVLGSRVLVGRK